MKENILYLECYSGISGDMTVAALLDLGADQQILIDGLNSLNVDGYQIEIGRRAKNSIDACDFNVILDSEINSDYGKAHSDHVHEHSHDHNHHQGSHSHNHPHARKAPLVKSNFVPHLVLGNHEHRNLFEINDIIEQSGISDRAKQLSKKIFHIIASAEAKAHAKPLEEVHFHEVGAVDSIVDIVAAAICLDNLNINNVVVTELHEGTGQIKCQHGLLPIPVPAVVNISAMHQLPLHITNVQGELVTPTGAAIVAAIRTMDELPSEMKILNIGLGAGKRNYPGASGILRAMLIEDCSGSISPTTNTIQDKVWVLEANIDDCTGEALALAMDLLLQNGAKDVYYTPIYMKKNRPAYLLGVICSEKDIPLLEGILFTHTTTIGIRKTDAQRTILPREIKTISTPYGDALVKLSTYQERTFIYPEYESVKALCLTSGQDYMTMYHLIQSIALTQQELKND